MKNKVFAIAIVVAVIAIFVIPVITSLIPDYGEIWLDSADFVVDIKENGDINITETWTVGFDTDDPFRNVYKSFDLYDDDFKTASTLTNITVYDVDRGIYYDYKEGDYYSISKSAENVWYLSEGITSKEFGVIFPKVGSGKRTFSFNYTITNFLGQYNDCTVFYYKLFSSDFEMYIKSFKLTVNMPNGLKTDNSLFWLHAVSETSNSYAENTAFKFTAKGYEPGENLDVRILLSNSDFPAVSKKSAVNAKASIINTEQEWADDYEKELKAKRTKQILDVVFASLFLAAAIAYAVFIKLFYNKKKDGLYPEYIREVPDGWTAGEYGHLFYYYKGGVNNNDTRGRLLSATMLDLARRHYIEIIPDENGKDFLIDVKDESSAKLEYLKPHERILYHLLLRVEKTNGKPFNMDQFEKYAKKRYSEINEAMSTYQKMSKAKFDDAKYGGSTPTLFKSLRMAGLVMAGAGFFFFTGLDTLPFFLASLVVSGLIIALFTPQIAKLNENGEEEYMKSQALKKFMLDFSNLKEYGVPQLILWEEYLVFATMMGISKEVIKSLELVYPELREISTMSSQALPSRSYLFTYLWLSNSSRSFGSLDFGSRMVSSFTNMATTARNLANPPSSGGGFGGGGGGGGGFRGGGGGFGGGGGGGRR